MLACQSGNSQPSEVKNNMTKISETKNAAVATLAGGCFWCVASDMKKLPGVEKVVSGYAGGKGENPTYESYEKMGYLEAVQVYYDPRQVSYERILNYFMKHVDPTDAGGQFADRGSGYRTAIFYNDEQEKKTARQVLQNIAGSGRFNKPIATEITKFTGFYPAEDYHQDYDQKNPLRYESYRTGSGREGFIREVWKNDEAPTAVADPKYGKPDKETLKKKLTKTQYDVTQNCGTEPPFQNEYVHNKKRASTLMSFPGSRSSVRSINMTRARDGRVLPGRWSRLMLWRKRTAVFGQRARKSAVNTPILIWDMCFRTVRRRPACAIA